MFSLLYLIILEIIFLIISLVGSACTNPIIIRNFSKYLISYLTISSTVCKLKFELHTNKLLKLLNILEVGFLSSIALNGSMS